MQYDTLAPVRAGHNAWPRTPCTGCSLGGGADVQRHHAQRRLVQRGRLRARHDRPQDGESKHVSRARDGSPQRRKHRVCARWRTARGRHQGGHRVGHAGAASKRLPVCRVALLRCGQGPGCGTE